MMQSRQRTVELIAQANYLTEDMGAEICELVGLFILKEISDKFPKEISERKRGVISG